MSQEIFWTVSSVHLLFTIILTVVNIVVSRKTSLQINRLTQLTSIEQKQHDKLIAQFAAFLDAIDENKITLPSTKLTLIVDDAEQRDLTLSKLISCKSNAEISYCQLLLLLQYSKTDSSTVEHTVNSIMASYRSMYEDLMSGLVDHIRYYGAPVKIRESIEELVQSSTYRLASYSHLRTDYVKQKDLLLVAFREFVDNEIKSINHSMK